MCLLGKTEQMPGFESGSWEIAKGEVNRNERTEVWLISIPWNDGTGRWYFLKRFISRQVFILHNLITYFGH